MSRLLFWIAFIVLVVMAVRSKLREASPRPTSSPRQPPRRPQAPQVESEPMTSCGQCGIYFPASEAVHAGGHDYCCAAHAGQASH
ncbi:MAG: PP0621 family protein [Telluria sp.]